jgi:hypothetical protein
MKFLFGKEKLPKMGVSKLFNFQRDDVAEFMRLFELFAGSVIGFKLKTMNKIFLLKIH